MFRIGQEEINAVTRVIESRDLFKANGGAQEVRHFQTEFSEKLEVEHTILMTSGKAALICALIGMGIGPGDEVIVPAYTYVATAIAVTAVGAIPVVCEVDESLTLDPEDFENKITENTKAVIPVHIMGFPCNMEKICEIAKRHNVFVLEDACQSDGGSFKGKRLGTHGDAGAFSFNYFKIITAGEGGAMVTDNRTIFERALIYHDSSAIAYFGNQLENVEATQFCGSEFRVSEFTGAIMREQLKRLDSILEDLRKNKKYLMDRLSSKYRFIASNDIEGDCALALPFVFETAEESVDFRNFLAENSYPNTRPIENDRHIYTTWKPIMEKRGAIHPAFDPFKMEANKNLRMDYSQDMCQKSLDIISKVTYLEINPDWQTDQLDALIEKLMQK